MKIWNFRENIQSMKEEKTEQTRENESTKRADDPNTNFQPLVSIDNKGTDSPILPQKSLLDTSDANGIGNAQISSLKLKYNQFMKFLRSSSLSIDKYEEYCAKSIVNTLSKGEHTGNDVLVVKRHLVIFLNMCISCFIVYNWYFVMFFRSETGERIKTLELSLNKIKQTSPIFHFFFKFTMCVLSLIDDFLVNTAPFFISKIFKDRRLQFISLFLSVFLIIDLFGFAILNSIDSSVVIGLYVGVFVLYELYCVLTDFLPNENGSIDISRIHKYTIFGSITPLLYLMLFFIRLVWSISIITVTSFINCAYAILMSFFAIPIYSTSIFDTFNSFRRINKYIWGSKQLANGGIVEVVIRILYRFLYEISFIIFLLFTMSVFSTMISKTTNLITFLNCICASVVFVLMFIAFQRHAMNGSLSEYIEQPDNPIQIPDTSITTSEPIQIPDTNITTSKPIQIPDTNITTSDPIQIPDTSITTSKPIQIPDTSITTSDPIQISDTSITTSKPIQIPDTNITGNLIQIPDTTKKMMKDHLVNTMLSTVKSSKYEKIIPSKILSSLI